MLGLFILSIIILIGIGALIYGMYEFKEKTLEFLSSTDKYVTKLYNVVDKNFKKEEEILNTLTEWRNKDDV